MSNNKSDKNNKDKKQDIKKEIIDYYLRAENKKKAIEYLCEKYDFSPQWIYQILKESDIATPSKFKNDIDSDNIKKPEIVLQSFDDSEIYSDSLIKKYKDHGFYERDDAERNMNIQIYAEEITGLDVWNNYFYYLRQLIYDTEKTQLQTDLAEIKKGNFGKIKTVDTIMDDISLSFAKEVEESMNPKLAEPSKPEPEPQEDQWGEMIRLINPQMYLKYKLISDPRVKEEFINAYNQYQQYNELLKSKNPNLKNINLKQKIKFDDIFPNEKEVKDIEPKERDVNLTPQEIRKFIKSSMPEPMPKRAHNKKKVD